jgi:hypothetical protein
LPEDAFIQAIEYRMLKVDLRVDFVVSVPD